MEHWYEPSEPRRIRHSARAIARSDVCNLGSPIEEPRKPAEPSPEVIRRHHVLPAKLSYRPIAGRLRGWPWNNLQLQAGRSLHGIRLESRGGAARSLPVLLRISAGLSHSDYRPRGRSAGQA